MVGQVLKVATCAVLLILVGCGGEAMDHVAAEPNIASDSNALPIDDPDPSRDPCPPCRMELYSDGRVVGYFEDPPEVAGLDGLEYVLKQSGTWRRPFSQRYTLHVVEQADGLKTFEVYVAADVDFVLDIAGDIPDDGVSVDEVLASISLPKHYMD